MAPAPSTAKPVITISPAIEKNKFCEQPVLEDIFSRVAIGRRSERRASDKEQVFLRLHKNIVCERPGSFENLVPSPLDRNASTSIRRRSMSCNHTGRRYECGYVCYAARPPQARTLSTSTNTHRDAMQPVTPKVACPRSRDVATRDILQYQHYKSPINPGGIYAPKRGPPGSPDLSPSVLLAPGPIQPKVRVVLFLSDGGMAVTEQ